MISKLATLGPSFTTSKFGTCTNCEETIARNRLVAIPWTPFCIRCQEVVDGGDASVVEPAYQLDFYAA
jgi:RNA polymerase-binding transcription factor DksA